MCTGVFGDLQFPATEAQPRDIYLLNIYDNAWNKPAECYPKTHGPDCQLMGSCMLCLSNSTPTH